MNQTDSFHVLYLSAELPKQSETFVYREVLGLRGRGVRVSVASVHAPQKHFGERSVDALAEESLQIYPPGKLRLLKDAALSLLRLGGWRALFRGLKDAIVERDIPLRKRPKVIWQCLAGLALARRLRGRGGRGNRGVTHIHSHMAHVPTTIAMYAATALGIPFSFTGHAADLFRDRCLLAAKLRRASRVMCISHWHRRFYQGIVPVKEEKLPVVRCGVDVTEWRTASTSSPDILAVGRLVPKKGFDVLIRGVARLRYQGMNVNCSIVGDGPQHGELSDLIRELALEKQVRLLGALSNETVRGLMKVHGVFALPCRIDGQQDRDGIPVVLMEAMACGAAVISGDLPTIRELIEHDVSGLLVPPDDVNALTAALHGLLTDPQRRRQLGEAARRTVAQEFSLEMNLERLEVALRPKPQPAAKTDEVRDVQHQLLLDQPLPR